MILSKSIKDTKLSVSTPTYVLQVFEGSGMCECGLMCACVCVCVSVCGCVCVCVYVCSCVGGTKSPEK